MVEQNWSGGDYEFREHIPRRERTVRSEDLSREPQGEPGEPQPTESKNDAEARADFWSIQGDFVCRHHIEPRVQLFVPKEEAFLVPLKYIDVARSTHTDLDVMQEKRIDDCWNICSNRSLSDSWKGFTKFTLLKENLPKDICGLGEIDKSSNDYQTFPCMARSVDQDLECRSESRKTRMEKREAKTRQCSTTEGNLLYDLDKQDYKETLKIARRKLDRPMAGAMPCKKKARTSNTKVAAEVIASQKVPKTIYGCTVDSHESTRQRVEPSPLAKYEDHIAVR